MHHDLFGEGPAGHGLVQLAAIGHGEGAVIAVIGCLAASGAPCSAGGALPAGANERNDDRIADREPVKIDLDLARLGCAQVNVLYAERCAEFVADGGLDGAHEFLPRFFIPEGDSPPPASRFASGVP